MAMNASERAGGPLLSSARWQPRLAARIMSLTFPGVAIIVLITQGILAWLDYQEREEQLATRASMIADLTSEAIARPLWMLDRSIYEAQVQAVEQDPAFISGRILDSRGEEVLTIGRPAGGDSFSVTRDIVSPQGAIIGTFELVMSRQELRSAFNRQLLLAVLAFAVLLLIFTFAVHQAVRTLVIRPLEQMLQAMRKVERKTWARLEWQRSDELGRAGQAFDAMVEGLRSGDEAKRLLSQLEHAQESLVAKSNEVEAAHRQLTENLAYARRIQEALMLRAEDLERHFAEAALLWRPLQQVGGDHCWLLEQEGRYVLFMADCTGHGVPGAFMTLITASALDQAVRQNRELLPSELLLAVDRHVRDHLTGSADAGTDDGLDAACCIYDPEHRQLIYAGANIPLLVQQNGCVDMVRATRGSLGYQSLLPPAVIEDKTFDVVAGMSFYLFTDGVPEQMGSARQGDRQRLFGRRRLRLLLEQQLHLPLREQVMKLEEALARWRGREPQRDDYALVAFRPF